MRLDGNVVGGILGEAFAVEMTTAVSTCGACGAVAQIAELHVYVAGPGTVVRCAGCETVLMRVVMRPGGRILLDLSGTRVLELSA